MNTVLIKDKSIDKLDLIKYLNKNKIQSRPLFYPLSSMPPYKSLSNNLNYREINKVSYKISPKGINLPSAFNLEEKDIKKVCSVLSNFKKLF